MARVRSLSPRQLTRCEPEPPKQQHDTRWLTKSPATRFKTGVVPQIDLSKLTATEKDALIPSLLPLGEQQAALAEWAGGGAASAGAEAAEDA